MRELLSFFIFVMEELLVYLRQYFFNATLSVWLNEPLCETKITVFPFSLNQGSLYITIQNICVWYLLQLPTKVFTGTNYVIL